MLFQVGAIPMISCVTEGLTRSSARAKSGMSRKKKNSSAHGCKSNKLQALMGSRKNLALSSDVGSRHESRLPQIRYRVAAISR